jgi:hypothetical protein
MRGVNQCKQMAHKTKKKSALAAAINQLSNSNEGVKAKWRGKGGMSEVVDVM